MHVAKKICIFIHVFPCIYFIHMSHVYMYTHDTGADGVWVPNRNVFYFEALAERKIEREREKETANRHI